MLLLRRVVAGRLTRVGPMARHVMALSAWAAILGAIGACGGTDPRIPTSVSLNPTAVSFTALGQTQQLLPSVTDQDGNSLAGAEVSWGSGNTGVATVSASGVVTAVGAGTTDVTATSGSATATAPVTVAQTPTQLLKVSGDAQTATAGTTLPAPLVVQVNDAGGSPISGASVAFAVAEGDGSIGTATATTGSDGRGSTTFTTGTNAGSTQAVSATIATTTLSVSFTAIAAADPTSFNIGLQFLSSATPAQRQAFTDARLRWEAAITDDLLDLLVQVPAGTACSDPNLPAVNQNIDDVVILVTLRPIDGAFGILALAGPCYVRDFGPQMTLEPGDLPILGTMQFDTDDLAMLEADGSLSDVILHEMGHVLGIGSLWLDQGFLADPAFPPSPAPPNPGADPHFTGPQGVAAFDDVGGVAYVAGAKVPVENTGDPITADGHWRESVFVNELMTGFVDAGQNPLSIVTLASLADQGYGVDLATADSYSLLGALRAFRNKPKLQLMNDILRGPIRTVDSRGRVSGVLDR